VAQLRLDGPQIGKKAMRLLQQLPIVDADFNL
jgi:hypothetical protein